MKVEEVVKITARVCAGVIAILTIGFASRPVFATSLSQADIELNCAGTGNCPNYAISVAFASDWNQEVAGICSGALVQGGYAVINSHCLPSFLQSQISAADCSRNLRIFRHNSQTGHTESFRCRRVLFSTESAMSETQARRIPDVAVIEVAGLPRGENYPELGREGLIPGNTYSMLSTRANGQNQYSRSVRTGNCRVTSQSVLLARSSEYHDPVMLVAGCEVIPGQSGSVLMDQNGKVQGVIFAYQRLGAAFSEPRDGRGNPIQFALAANLSCVIPGNVSYLNSPQPSQCRQYLGLSEEDREEEDRLAFKTLIRQAVRNTIAPTWDHWRASASTDFLWIPNIIEAHDEDGLLVYAQFRFTPVPKCVSQTVVSRIRVNGSRTFRYSGFTAIYQAQLNDLAQLRFEQITSVDLPLVVRVRRRSSGYEMRVTSGSEEVANSPLEVCSQ